jgi:hypothetical protein
MVEGKITARTYYWCPNRHELSQEDHQLGKCFVCGWDRNNPIKNKKPKVITTEVVSKEEQIAEAQVNTSKVETPKIEAAPVQPQEVKPETLKVVTPVITTSTTSIEAPGDDEALPIGTLYRILKPLFKGREKGFTKEFVPALSVYLVKHMKEISNGAMDAAQNDNRKCVTIAHLKTAGEKMGIEF